MKTEMHWIEINKTNLPKGEVLSANFNPFSYGYKEKLLGFLYIEKGIVIASNKNEVLENCTHFIDIHKHDPIV